MTTHPDELTTRVLTALRDTEAPCGLEARVAARLAQAADAHTNPASRRTASSIFAATVDRTSLFAVILSIAKDPRILLAQPPIYALAAAGLLMMGFVAIHLHKPQTNANVATNQVSQGFSLGSHRPAKEEGALAPARGSATTLVPQGWSAHVSQGTATTQVPQGFSLGSHSPAKEEGALTPADLDTIALAETRAPSRPAPPMPLTPQEQLLAAATRRGQPIELAELDLLRAPTLRSAAEARERSTLRQFAQGLLGPLAAAEALNPDPPPNP